MNMKTLTKLLTTFGFILFIIVFVCNTATSQTYTIGQKYEEGIIFYIDSTGNHGLIAAVSDQSTAVEWGCEDLMVIDAEYGTFVGAGSQNTDAMLENCTESETAASACSR